MSPVEDEVCRLLTGQSVETTIIDVTPAGAEQYIALTKESVCYIVCGVLFNEKGELLMTQEAKRSCHGMWYLPAGRMEQGETIVEGAKREVLEETGMEFEPTSLLSVEVASGFWYRFTFLGRITGGQLRTLDQKDKETLQARWCSLEDIKRGRKEFPLRSTDVLPLIDMALKYKDIPNIQLMPVNQPHTKLLLRLLITVQAQESSMSVLTSDKQSPHIPISTICVSDSNIQLAIMRLLQDIFQSVVQLLPHVVGVLSLEHCGKPSRVNDGMCLTLLVTLPHTMPPNNLTYRWHPLPAAESEQLRKRLGPDSRVVPLLMLRKPQKNKPALRKTDKPALRKKDNPALRKKDNPALISGVARVKEQPGQTVQQAAGGVDSATFPPNAKRRARRQA